MAMHWAIRVLSVAGGRVALEVRTLHGDARRPDETATFALGLVLDHWRRVVARYDVTHHFWENLAHANARPEGPPWDARLEPLQELAFGEELVVSRAEFEVAYRARRFRDRAFIGGGPIGPKSEGRHRLLIEGDWSAYVEVAARTVRDLRAVDAVNQAAYDDWPDDDDEARQPRVTLEFEVEPSELVSFLREGMTWESAVHR